VRASGAVYLARSGITAACFAMAVAAFAQVPALASPAQTDSGPSDEQICEVRYTNIRMNIFPVPGARTVSEEELAWAKQQTERKERGESCLLPDGFAAQFRDAMRHNAAFEAGTRTAVSPRTTVEQLVCAAVWNRWNYAVDSAAGADFVQALRPELSAANADRREAFWRAQDGEAGQAGDEGAAAEEQADDLYAAYAQNEEGGLERLMERLAICK